MDSYSEGVVGQMRQRLSMQYEQLGRSVKAGLGELLALAHDSPAAPLLQSGPSSPMRKGHKGD